MVTGRPRKTIDWGKVDGMLLFDSFKRTIADELGIHEDTLERAIKRKFKMTFTEYKKIQVAKTVLRLKQTMIKKALQGDNVCLIFSLKNLSDWKDKQEVETRQLSTVSNNDDEIVIKIPSNGR